MKGRRIDPDMEEFVEELEAAGLDVAFAYKPTEEEARAAGARLASQEQKLRDLSGTLPPALIEFDPRGARWDDTPDPLWLLTPKQFDMVPDGSVLVCITGETRVKGTYGFDRDTRFGHMAWGFLESQLPRPAGGER